MARLNLTVPDPLYERLERLRDRVNVSKVCAVALEKELDMIEVRPSVADPKIIRLLDRLKGAREQWYERGHSDGLDWATEVASRADLQLVGVDLRGVDGREMAITLDDETGEGDDRPRLPGFDNMGSLYLKERPWAVRDLGLEEEPHHTDTNYAAFCHVLQKADDAAYLEGWRDALVELWDAVAPVLR